MNMIRAAVLKGANVNTQYNSLNHQQNAVNEISDPQLEKIIINGLVYVEHSCCSYTLEILKGKLKTRL